MKPAGGGEPAGAIAAQIKADFGDFEAFKKLFNETTAKQFGSGWGWLVVEAGKLKVVTTANQDNPISERPLPHPRQRRLGARLLPEVQQPPPRLPRRLVEHRQLGRESTSASTTPRATSNPHPRCRISVVTGNRRHLDRSGGQPDCPPRSGETPAFVLAFPRTQVDASVKGMGLPVP